MATKTSRPGRTLAVFLAAMLAMFAAAAAVGNWTPKLGLDLQGGMRITLQARTDTGGGVTKDKLDEAVGIISSRVNGAGVAEAEVTTQGADIIVVEIPGSGNKDLERTLGSTAQLRFRLVELVQGPPRPQQQPPSSAPTTPADTSGTSPAPPDSTGTPRPTTSPKTGPTASTGPAATAPTAKPADPSPSKNRVAARWFSAKPSPTPPTPTTPTPVDKTTPGGTSPSPPTTPNTPAPTVLTPTPGALAGATPTTGGPPTALLPPDLEVIPDPLNWQPTQEWQAKFLAFRCPQDGAVSSQQDLPSQPLIACNDQGVKYLLGPAMIE